MPSSLTGAAVDPTTSPHATCPVDTDAAVAASVDTPFQLFLNWIAWIRQKMARVDAATTFYSGLASNIGPSAATDVARKAEVDAEATARSGADATLQSSISTEALARANGDSAEALARSGGDTATLAAAQAYADSLKPGKVVAVGLVNWDGALTFGWHYAGGAITPYRAAEGAYVLSWTSIPGNLALMLQPYNSNGDTSSANPGPPFMDVQNVVADGATLAAWRIERNSGYTKPCDTAFYFTLVRAN